MQLQLQSQNQESSAWPTFRQDGQQQASLNYFFEFTDLSNKRGFILNLDNQ